MAASERDLVVGRGRESRGDRHGDATVHELEHELELEHEAFARS